MLQETFDPNGIDTSTPQITKDWYPCVITGAEESATKANTGSYVLVIVTIMSGAFSGWNSRDYINYRNPNPTAQEMGQKSLAKICNALGLPQLTDEQILIGQKLDCLIGPEKDSDFSKIFDYRAAENAATDQGDFKDLESDFAGNTQAPAPTPAPNPWQG